MIRTTADGKRRLGEHAEVIRRELGLATDDEAIAAAAARLARELVLG